METSIFANKEDKPDDQKLHLALGDMYENWMGIRSFVLSVYPQAAEEWNFPAQKYGWSFRLKDKKRAIIYLLPRNRFFMVALVFGAKATSAALSSDINPDIKHIIETAKVYAEGRGFCIEIRNETAINDVKKLVNIKLS